MNKTDYNPKYPIDLSSGSVEELFTSMQKIKLEQECIYKLITDKLNLSADELDQIRKIISDGDTDLEVKFNKTINDLEIPNKTLTVQKNGTAIDSYNGFSNKIINILVPTKLSELTNDLKNGMSFSVISGMLVLTGNNDKLPLPTGYEENQCTFFASGECVVMEGGGNSAPTESRRSIYTNRREIPIPQSTAGTRSGSVAYIVIGVK